VLIKEKTEMKGIIINITERFIIDNYGEDIFNEIIASCNLETKEPFVAPGTYPDSDLFEIVVKGCKKLDLTVEEFLKKLGHYSFAQLAERHPSFLESYTHPKAFLQTVDGVIHLEVRKLYQDSKLPVFQYSDPSKDELIITYYSERKLYPFLEGMINGVSDHFGVAISQTNKVYQKDGVELCDFYLKFAE
jgi:hypothetical protein